MSSTIEFIFIKIGSADCKGPGVRGNTSLNVISKIKILSSSVLNAEPHTTIA